MTAIGQALKTEREAQGLTQQELAKMAKVSQQTVSHIEKGRIKFPTYQTAIKLGQALNVPHTKFLDSVGQAEEKPQKELSTIERLRAKLKGNMS